MSALPRSSLRDVRAYARPPMAALNLSDNTNRWGAAPSAVDALDNPSAALTDYPEPYADSLKRAIGDHLGVSPDRVTTGCGSDGVLDASLRAYGEVGARVAIPEPTFPMAAVFARINALKPFLLPLDSSGQPDADAVARSRPDLVYLCSPNNPLGTTCDTARVERIVAETRGLVIVDEAYADFSGGTLVRLTERHRNLLVTRTMSKAFGLAGLRVGYAVGSPEVIASIERARGPYTVSALGAAAAVAALRRDVAWMRACAAEAIHARDALIRALQQRGMTPLPSAANFVFVPVAGAPRLASALATRGVSVRAFTGLRSAVPALQATQGDALRITVAPPAETLVLLDALDAALAEAACA
jgi:histidinol-phosphate aminotransferase